jgi:hypothetical protein
MWVVDMVFEALAFDEGHLEGEVVMALEMKQGLASPLLKKSITPTPRAL